MGGRALLRQSSIKAGIHERCTVGLYPNPLSGIMLGNGGKKVEDTVFVFRVNGLGKTGKVNSVPTQRRDLGCGKHFGVHPDCRANLGYEVAHFIESATSQDKDHHGSVSDESTLILSRGPPWTTVRESAFHRAPTFPSTTGSLPGSTIPLLPAYRRRPRSREGRERMRPNSSGLVRR